MKRTFRLIRQTLCVILALALLCSCAQAAPGRDMGKMDIKINQSLRAFVNLLGGACLLRDVRELRENEKPSEPFLEGVLLLGLSRGLLPRTDGEPADGTETLPVSDAEKMLSGLFACPDGVSFPQKPGCPCMKRIGDELTVDYHDVEASTSGGARIFSVRRDGQRLNVLADVFSSLASWETDPLVVAEDCLTWEYTVKLVLEEAASRGSPLDYRLVSMESYPEWGQGCLDNWRSVRKNSFSFIMPPAFSRWSEGAAQDTGNAEYRFETNDGSAVLTATVSQNRSQHPLSCWRTAARPLSPRKQKGNLPSYSRPKTGRKCIPSSCGSQQNGSMNTASPVK